MDWGLPGREESSDRPGNLREGYYTIGRGRSRSVARGLRLRGRGAAGCGETPEEARGLPARRLVGVCDVAREIEQQPRERRGCLEVQRLVQVVRRLVIALARPVLEPLRFGRAGRGADL